MAVCNVCMAVLQVEVSMRVSSRKVLRHIGAVEGVQGVGMKADLAILMSLLLLSDGFTLI